MGRKRNKIRFAEENDAPLHCACNEGNVKLVKSLVTNGAKVNAKGGYGDTPLHRAVQKSTRFGNTVFDKHGVIIRRETFIIGNEDVEIVKFLIASRADVNAKGRHGNTPLHRACENGNEDFVKVLVTNGADVNVKNELDQTPLCMARSIEVLKILVANGADVNVKDWSGKTPLHNAVRLPANKVVEFFVTNGADLHIKDNDGYTPFHRAVEARFLAYAKLLISNGADVNTKNKNGNTPFHWACEKGNATFIKFLISEGANINPENNDGKMPLNLVAVENTNISLFLIVNGASCNVVFDKPKNSTTNPIAKKSAAVKKLTTKK
jgi:ankyrin repeat protein